MGKGIEGEKEAGKVEGIWCRNIVWVREKVR